MPPDLTTKLDRIRELFLPSLTFLGFELYDIKMVSGQAPTLRVMIDRPEGITLDDCERVSRSLSALLDQADPLPTRYDLEVSSPGAERPLRSIEEYRRFVGRRANVRYRVQESERVAEGRLLAVTPEAVEIELRTRRTLTVPLNQILAARLAVDL